MTALFQCGGAALFRVRISAIVAVVSMMLCALPSRAQVGSGFSGPRLKAEVSAAQAQTLSAQTCRLIADYGSFQLWDVPAELREAIESGGGTIHEEANRIELHAGVIQTDPAAARPGSSTADTTPGSKLHLVQFAGPIKTEWHQALIQQGWRIVSYVPQNAYLIYGDAAALARLQAALPNSPEIQWEGPYAGENKIHPEARTAAQKAAASQPTDDLFAIQLIEDPQSNPGTLQALDTVKREWLKRTTDLGYVNCVIRVPPEQLATLAARPDVVSIQTYQIPQKRDERQGQILAGNLTGNVPSGPGYLSWLGSKGFAYTQFAGSGFAVDVSDSGIDNGTQVPGHFGLYTLGNTSLAGRVVYNRLLGSPNSGSTIQACDGHGNLNSHIIAGYNDLTGFPHTDSAGFHYGLGICPFVRVGSSVIFDPNSFTFPNYNELQSRAYQDGARISCNSWGASVGGAYNIDCQMYDALVRDAQPAGSPFPTAGNQEMVIVFSAGNSGSGANSIGAPGSAKNIISVGAAENVHSHSLANGGADVSGNDGCAIDDSGADNANDIIFFSSRGPCDDGRIKPDIMGPGTHVTGGVGQQPSPGANGTALACFFAGGVCALPGGGSVGSPFDFFPTGQQFFTTSSGTSHSCPAIGGGAALLRQYFLNHTWGAPSPAMTKAWLMGSTRYMNGSGANDTLPSNNQGMGSMNLGMGFDNVPRVRRDQKPEDRFTATGQLRTFEGFISDPTKPFRATIAWTDAPGSTTGNSYNNNLDLTVDVGGQTYRGNVFVSSTSVPGGVADFRNNVESVFLPAGLSGQFTITVTAANINSDGVPGNADPLDQDFALVVYNSSEGEVLLQPAGAAVIAEGCTPGQGTIDPGETVTVNFSIRNFGPSNTTALVATLLPTGGVYAPSGPQNYNLIPANASAAVTRPFTFTAVADCGGELIATLQLQDGTNDYGTIEFPFLLGTMQTNLLAFTNAQTITIDAFTGAVAAPYPSSIAVSGLSGTVRKATVTLNGLSHTWPDDLDILLVGPQGQAVLLLSDAGGNSDASNLTLTFDSAAASGLPDEAPLTSGTWRPTNFEDDSPLPGAPPASSASLNAFAGTNPNGTWRLYVADDYSSDDGGQIVGGWTLGLEVTNNVCCVDPASADLETQIVGIPSSVTISNTVNYNITVLNHGPAAASGVILNCALAASAGFEGAVLSQGSYAVTGGVVTCSLGSLAAGANATITVTARALAGPELSATATATAAQADPNPLNNVAVATTAVPVSHLTIQDTTVIEGDSGTSVAVFLVALSQPAVQTVTVDYFTRNGTAVAGLDYVGQTNTLTFSPGDLFQTIEVLVPGDTQDEADETFDVVLTNSVNAELSDGVATGTILDDDPLPSMSIGDTAVVEGNSGTTSAVFNLSLSSASGRSLSVVLATTNGTAIAPGDYVAINPRVVTFQPGQTSSNIAVNVIGDLLIERDETFFVLLSAPTNVTLADATAVGTIVTDDLAPVIRVAGFRVLSDTGGITNGVIDPSETVTISLALVNDGSADTTNLVATLQAAGGVLTPSGPQNFGVLTAGGPQISRSFTFTVGAGNCSTLGLNVALQDGAASLGTASLATRVGNCFFDDFEPDIDLPLWSAFGGSVGSTVMANNYGGSVSGTNSLWFGGDNQRYAVTRAIDTHEGGQISFYLRLGNGGAAGVWETVDVPGEGVVSEYSVNNGVSWVQFGIFDTTEYYSWTLISTNIPVGAQSASTLFRWRQMSHSGACCDHWALDDVSVTTGPQPPSITSQPANVTAIIGGVANFSISVNGSSPLIYQWRYFGTNILDETNSALTLINVQTNQAGPYSVTVANAYGSVVSSNAILNVVNSSGAVVVFDDPLFVDSAGSTASESDNVQASLTNFNFVVATCMLSNVANFVSSGITLLIPEQEVGPIAPSLSSVQRSAISNAVVNGATLIVHGTFNGYAASLVNTVFGVALVESGSSLTTTKTAAATGTEFADDPPTIPANNAITALTTTSLPGGSAAIYANGTQTTVAIIPRGLGKVIFLGWDWFDARPRGTQDSGWLAVLQSAVLEGGGSGDHPPVIVSQPSDQTVLVNGTTSFNVSVFGTPPLSFQWRFNGTNLPGATNAALTLVNVQTNQAGPYSVFVSNSFGTTLSSNATLNIINATGDEFQIVTLRTNNSFVTDHDALTGDDRGGIAASFSRVFYSGDTSTARFQLSNLSGGTALGQIFDALVSDLRSGKVYSLANGLVPLTSSGGTATTLVEHDPITGALTGTTISLSTPITLPTGGNVGIFAGYGRIILHTGTRAYAILLPLGQVIDLGSMTIPTHVFTESWAYWGVAEYWAGVMYMVYVRDSQTIVRTRIPDGLTTVVSSFSYLSDMAAFTVSPLMNRWYFHYEGSAQFGGTSETIGYADAVFSLSTSSNPPVIVTQPVSQSVVVNASADFNVAVFGTPPFTYQWRFNGSNIVGATNSALALINVQTNQSGPYSVVVSNAFGSVLSSNAMLTVVPLSGAIVVFDDPIFVDSADSTSSESDNVQGSVTNLGYAVITCMLSNLTGFASSGSTVIIPEQEFMALAPSLSALQRSSISNAVISGGTLIVDGTSSGAAAGLINSIFGLSLSEGGSSSAFTKTAAAAGTQFADDPPTLPANNATTVLTGLPAGALSIYASGAQSAVAIIPRGLGRVIFLGWDWYDARPRGVQDGGWLTALQSAILEGGGSSTSLPPTIVTQPVNQFVLTNGTANFSVAVVGTPPFSYQWRFNGTNLPGATNAALTLVNVQTSQSGPYSVSVSNLFGSVVSSNATLTVLTSPQNYSVLLIWDVINANTLSLVSALTNAGIGVALSATDERSYDGSNPSPTNYGAVIHLNGTTYDVDMPLAGQNALVNYVRAGGGYIHSEWDAYELGFGRMAAMRDLILIDRTSGANGILTLNTVPGQAGHPVLTNVPSGFSFSAGYNTGTNHIFATYPSTVLMRDGSLDDAVVVRQFELGRIVGFHHAGNYEASSGFNTLANPFVQQLFVNAVRWAGTPLSSDPPLITSQPSDQTVFVGSNATFTVSASGSPPILYQWRFAGTNISGATNASYTRVNAQLNHAGLYSVRVSNFAGFVVSSNANLSVLGGAFGNVVVFDDPLFVDTAGTTNSESDNIQGSLTNLGFTPITCALSNLTSQLLPSAVVLFPEQEMDLVAPALSANQRSMLSNLVQNGGVLIVHGSSRNGAAGLMNSIFGWSLVESFQVGAGAAHVKNAAAAGTQFADDPPTLPMNDACSTLALASLPTNALPVYTSGAECVVAMIHQGSGKVIFLGWDWYNAAPRGVRDGGWRAVLQSAILERDPANVSPPTILAPPVDLVVLAGNPASFSVLASGAQPLSYQWRFNAANISGATNAMFLLPSAQTNNEGLYSVRVANYLGSITSSPAMLVVNESNKLVLNVVDSGWYSWDGFHMASDSNYFCGGFGFQEYRDWFVFNVPSLSNAIVSAQLRLYTYDVQSPDGFETFTLRHVSTPVGTLRAGGSGLTGIFADLAEGAVYGSRNIFVSERNQYVTVPLNQSFVTNLLNSGAGLFALGGHFSSLNSSGGWEDAFDTEFDPTNRIQLVLEFTNAPLFTIRMSNILPDGSFQLMVSEFPGAGFNQTSLPQVRIYWTTNLSLPPADWPELTTPGVFSNGVLRIEGLSISNEMQFFRAEWGP